MLPRRISRRWAFSGRSPAIVVTVLAPGSRGLYALRAAGRPPAAGPPLDAARDMALRHIAAISELLRRPLCRSGPRSGFRLIVYEIWRPDPRKVAGVSLALCHLYGSGNDADCVNKGLHMTSSCCYLVPLARCISSERERSLIETDYLSLA